MAVSLEGPSFALEEAAFDFALEVELVFEAFVDLDGPFPGFFEVVAGFGVGFVTALDDLAAVPRGAV